MSVLVLHDLRFFKPDARASRVVVFWCMLDWIGRNGLAESGWVSQTTCPVG